MGHRMIAAGLQNIVEADDIGFDVGIGIGDGIADTGLRRQIHHHVKALFGEQLFHQGLVGDAATDKAPAVFRLLGRQFANLLQTVFLNGHVVVGIHIVKTHHRHAFQRTQQLLHQFRADKAGGTGDQNGLTVEIDIGCQHTLPSLSGISVRPLCAQQTQRSAE